MDIIYVKIFAIVFVVLLAACAYIIISTRKENSANNNKKKPIDFPHATLSPEKELPEKFTKKQFKRVEKNEEKLDDLEKKNSELEKRVKELSNQLEALKKEIKKIQKQEMNISHSISGNPSSVPSSIANKRKPNDENSRSIVATYERLTLGGDGNLIYCEEGYPVYYRAWRERERIRFEFVNSDRTKKAINNRSTFIEPFCNKTEESKFPDESDFIETITPGFLNDDYTVKEKAIIRYK